MTWYLFVERLLTEAQERGELDRLPGSGQPLDLAENPFEPADWRLANKILKDNRLLPEFLTRRKQIESLLAQVDDLLVRHGCETDRLRREGGDAGGQRRGALNAVTRDRYRGLLGQLNEEIRALNTATLRETHFNLSGLQEPLVDIDARLREFARRFPEVPPPAGA